jgi:CubicO group peptidase (beta-lactamase class C family)
VTVWGLLTHSAGLPRESDVPYWSPPDFTFPTRDEVRELLGEQETLYPAARHYQYSNLGLTLAGEIVAELSGRPYDDYVGAEILAPLGMTSTRTRMPTRDEEPRLAAGYAALDRNAERQRLAPFDAAGIGPAAGFSSTAHDLASFAAWQIRLLDGDPPADVLSANTLREMQRVQWLEPDWELARGLGFGVYKRGDHLYVGHSGSCPGYRSTVLVEHATGVGAAADGGQTFQSLPGSEPRRFEHDIPMTFGWVGDTVFRASDSRNNGSLMGDWVVSEPVDCP